MRYYILILIAIMAFPVQLQAESSDTEKPDVEARSEELLETSLPTTQHKRELDISIKPNSGDIVKEDFIRIPVRVKYGITENWEASATPLTYFDNFFRGHFGLFMTDIALGTKYNFGETYPQSGIDMALSFSHIIPLRYDTRISDGYYHYIPAVLFSTRIRESYNVGLGIGINLVQGEGPPNTVRPNNTLSTGVSLSHLAGKITYTLETRYITDEVYGGEIEEAYLTPGVSLDVKDWLKEVPGIWTFSSGLRIGLLDAPEDFELLVRLKLHIRFDYKVNVKKLLPLSPS